MTESAALQALQRRLGHHFARPTLLVQALTHRSFGAEHNERLEFLGDAVLSLGVSALLYERFSGLPEVLRLSEGEGRGGGAQRPSILADAVEALIGAVFLDGGYAPAQTVVQRLFGEVIQSTEADSWAKDAKTELQEWLQARRISVPAYRITATRGQAHAQTFEVECAVPSLGLAERGEGRSRRIAEQEAARRLLELLKASDRPGGPLRS